MQNTMELLDKALEMQPAPWWHKKLNLSRNALHNAKIRGNVSPAIAGALAEEMGESVEKWIVIAALESERESACKSRMVRKFLTGAALAGTLIGTSGAATASVAIPQITESSLYIMLNRIWIRFSNRNQARSLMLRIA